MIRLSLRQEPPVKVQDKNQFFKIVRAAFSQRRKTAANSIASAGRFTKIPVEQALAAAGAAKNARAEQLTLEQLATLSDALLKKEMRNEE